MAAARPGDGYAESVHTVLVNRYGWDAAEASAWLGRYPTYLVAMRDAAESAAQTAEFIAGMRPR